MKSGATANVLVALFLSMAGCLTAGNGDVGESHEWPYSAEVLASQFEKGDTFEVTLDDLVSVGGDAVVIEVLPSDAARLHITRLMDLPVAGFPSMNVDPSRLPCAVEVVDGDFYPYWPYVASTGTYSRSSYGTLDERGHVVGRSFFHLQFFPFHNVEARERYHILAGVENSAQFLDEGAEWRIEIEGSSWFYARLLDEGASIDCLTDISQTEGGTVLVTNSHRTGPTAEIEDAYWTVEGSRGVLHVEVMSDQGHEVDLFAEGGKRETLRHEPPLGVSTGNQSGTIWFDQSGEVGIDVNHLKSINSWYLRSLVLTGLDEGLIASLREDAAEAQ